MNKISVFNMIWDNTENIVLSQLREKLNNNMSSADELDRAYKTATGKFIYGNLIEKHWLNELKAEDSAKAERFLHTMNSFSFQQINYNNANTITGYIVTLAIAAITSTTLALTTELPLLKVFLWGVFGMIVSSGIFIPVFKRKQEKHKEDVINKYRTQMEGMRTTLINIIS